MTEPGSTGRQPATRLNRRRFLRMVAAASAPVALCRSSLPAAAELPLTLTVMHTNDVHSQIDPIRGGRNDGRGGAARRLTVINQVRAGSPYSLLLDAGDALQGTPYFNFYQGEIEFKLMTAMNYDVMTIGNHDFDAGVDTLAWNLNKFAKFDIVNANYEITHEYLRSRIQPYIIRQCGPIKIGIFGLGIKLKGLVGDNVCTGFTYGDPVKSARRMVERLKRKEKTDFIICLSHLSLRGYDGEVGDQTLAAEAPGIDCIIGGHSHTFMEHPDVIETPAGKTYINQVGFAGINLGCLDFHFNHRKQAVLARTHNRTVA